MKFTIDMLDGTAIPKRGDLVHTNVGKPKERTWFVLTVRRLKPTKGVPRAKCWLEGWRKIEPEMRLRLYRSAERNGGQRRIPTVRYPAKERMTFEQHMRRELG
jgi:hypothetical protein